MIPENDPKRIYENLLNRISELVEEAEKELKEYQESKK